MRVKFMSFADSGKRGFWCCKSSSMAQWHWCGCEVDWNRIGTKGIYHRAEATVSDKSPEHR